MPKKAAEKFNTDDQKWNAILINNSSADGVFWYGVTSTGIVCNPGCPSRNPNRENVRYFDEVSVAIDQGFRKCKRCH